MKTVDFRPGTGSTGKGSGSPTSPDHVHRLCTSLVREQKQLFDALERHYEPELKRISPNWTCLVNGQADQIADLTETVGVPGIVLGAVLAGKCRDQRIPVTTERQTRFCEWMHSHCASLWLTLNDSGVGSECAKGLVLVLSMNDRYTSLNLASNSLGDVGVAALAKVLPEHNSLLHMDLSANDIGHAGANAIFEGLLHNRSVTHLDLASKPGSLRNHFGRQNAPTLELLLGTNPILARLSMAGTCLGSEAAIGIARGLVGNPALTSLDLSGAEIGSKSVVMLAEALGSCHLEELNLSDNRLGDEGLMALALKLGAFPAGGDMSASITSWSESAEGIKASVKYQETISTLRRVMTDFNINSMAHRSEADRNEVLKRVSSAAEQLGAMVELATASLPRLRVLLVTQNGATVAGIAKMEDTLQINSRLEKLVLDHSDHRTTELGAKSLVTSLPVNLSLSHLSLGYCNLGTLGIIDLSKALLLNQGLQTLCLKGNQFGEEAAVALGVVLSSKSTALRYLNLNSCHLEDPSGLALTRALAGNRSLEALHMRDNLLREATGRALVDVLQHHTNMTQMTLELNGIEFRFLAQIGQLLERNVQTRKKARPQQYRKRIDQLLECKREVGVLEATIRRNTFRKRKIKMRQAAMLQNLVDTQAEERRKVLALEERLKDVRQERRVVDDELAAIQAKLRIVISEGEQETGQLNSRIRSIEDRVGHYAKHMEHTKKQLGLFEDRAGEELAALHEELERAEKARSSAESLSAAAQRNLDSFAASLKSIQENIAGGSDPRQRIVEVNKSGENISNARSRPSGARTPNRVPFRAGNIGGASRGSKRQSAGARAKSR